jgi:hypothetical protein
VGVDRRDGRLGSRYRRGIRHVTASPGAGGLGTATIRAIVTDASDGDTHVGTFDVEVVAGDAVTVNIIPGEVMPKESTP